MNRKQKIIVSITGIILVSLILIGLTYAYFLTKITGNTNTKSISVSTANLELVYGDGTTQILKNDTPLEPSSDAIGTKDFTVTNNGNSKTSYVVVIEDVVIKNITDNTTTTFNSNDFRYTLTCTKKDGTTCDGVTTQSVFPITGGIMVGNSIDVDDVQSYVLTLWYIDTGIDQSKDMGKILQAKVNIKDITHVTNPYSSNKNSLAYNIIENAKNKTNGTELLSSPKTQVAEEISGFKYYTDKADDSASEESLVISTTYQGYYWTYGTGYKVDENTGKFTLTGVSTCKYNDGTCHETLVGKYLIGRNAESNSNSTDKKGPTTNRTSIYKIIKAPTSSSSAITMKEKPLYSISYSTEKILCVTSDDYGMSYYYRGNVLNNYVNFAGMCWRAVRIAGDGSIKLILEDQDSTCTTSDGNWNIPTTTGGTITTGNFGYTEYAAGTLTASDGTQNTKTRYLMNYLNGETNKDKSMATAFENFQNGPLANYLDKLKTGDWCLNDKAYASKTDNTTALTSQEILDKQIKGTTFYYTSLVRLDGKTTKEPTLKCNGTNMNKFADNTDMYVGTLTADEVVYAGGKLRAYNSDYYLTNNLNKFNFWSWSPTIFYGDHDAVAHVTYYGRFIDDGNITNDKPSFRPAVQLKSNIQISGGNGTKENPYVIN